MYFILFYKTIENYIVNRTPYRDEHLEYARKANAEGSFVMAGALAEPAFLFSRENLFGRRGICQ